MEIITCVILFILVITFLYFILDKKKIKHFPPGPKGYPLFGNTFDIDQSNLHLTLTKWAKQYGGIFQVNLFGSKFVVLNSSDLVREALIKEPNATLFADRTPYVITRNCMYGATDIVFGCHSEQWTKRRKLGHKLLKAYGEGLTAMEKSVQEQLKIEVSYMKNTGGNRFDPEIMIDEFLSGIIIILLTGRRLGNDSAWAKIVREHDYNINKIFTPELMFVVDWMPLIRFLPGPISKVYRAYKCSQEKFENQIRMEKNSGSSGMIHHLYAEIENAWLPEETIFAILTDMIGAGILTSKGTIWSAIRILLHRQDVQKNLQEEVDNAVGSDRLPTLSDKSNMPYTEAFILETLRYISHLPLAVPHFVAKDTTLAGYDIQKGSTLLLNVWNIHRDSEAFPNPHEFKPERFLDEDGTLHPANSAQRRSFLSFGVGKRSCIGESFARNRIFLFTSTIMQHFTLVPEEDSEVAMLDPLEMESVIVRMPKRFNCRALARIT